MRRLARRLAIGLFLDVWPAWAVGSLLLGGLVALVCRMFLPGVASNLHWIWLAPILAALPALLVCLRRPYRPSEVAALADWLNGGHGMRKLRWIEPPGRLAVCGRTGVAASREAPKAAVSTVAWRVAACRCGAGA